MAHKMKFFLMTLVVLSVVQLTQQASVSPQVLSRGERSASNHTQEKKCENNITCGWAFYSPKTRFIEKFMKNTCECPEPLLCVRYKDDVEISAYVYRCQPSLRYQE